MKESLLFLFYMCIYLTCAERLMYLVSLIFKRKGSVCHFKYYFLVLMLSRIVDANDWVRFVNNILDKLLFLFRDPVP